MLSAHYRRRPTGSHKWGRRAPKIYRETGRQQDAQLPTEQRVQELRHLPMPGLPWGKKGRRTNHARRPIFRGRTIRCRKLRRRRLHSRSCPQPFEAPTRPTKDRDHTFRRKQENLCSQIITTRKALREIFRRSIRQYLRLPRQNIQLHHHDLQFTPNSDDAARTIIRQGQLSLCNRRPLSKKGRRGM